MGLTVENRKETDAIQIDIQHYPMLSMLSIASQIAGPDRGCHTFLRSRAAVLQDASLELIGRHGLSKTTMDDFQLPELLG
jgi:hypothetical protein